jgi:hypothetical protein
MQQTLHPPMTRRREVVEHRVRRGPPLEPMVALPREEVFVIVEEESPRGQDPAPW